MAADADFIKNRSLAVRLPAEFRLPEIFKKVTIRSKGMGRFISPVGGTWNEFFQHGPQAADDFLAERATQDQAERKAF